MISDYHVIDIDENSIGFSSCFMLTHVTVGMNVLHKFHLSVIYFAILLDISINVIR